MTTANGRLVRIVVRLCNVAISFPLSTSLASTTVIAVVRSCCVMMPFKVRDVFTAHRQIVAIVVSSCFTISVYIYTATLLKLTTKVQRNSTFIVLEGTSFQPLKFADPLKIGVFFLCLGIMFASVMILLVALKKSGDFRSHRSQTSSHQPMNATRKSTQATKSVLLVLVIFLVCNLPYALFSILRLEGLLADRHTSQMTGLIATFCLELNVGLNIFVYFSMNTKYRSVVKSWFA
ncbi:substance-K receptor [Elysia marginata]|uniref:Substance-K receptor n=1 Tax=Elysia marginata TaxID=1093978 RepID=A0AAV4J8X8_9GAST|nr:substance-K receptor [Elysia marginata]